MDILSDIIETLQLRGTLYFRTALSAPWGIQVPDLDEAARFHLVVRGQCAVRIDEDWHMLQAGDLILIPRGATHTLADSPTSKIAPLESVLKSSGFTGQGVLVHGGEVNGAATQLICGHFNFAEGADHRLLRILPSALIISQATRLEHLILDELLNLLARVMFSGQTGADTTVMRLSEAFFVEALRAAGGQSPELRQFFEVVQDPGIGRALSLMHSRPEQAWTVADLGREAAMSRSRFAATFSQQLAQTPMDYLTDWRLQKARRLLLQGKSVKSAAASVGYQSASAFTRSFSQRFGHPPSRLAKLGVH